MINSLTTRIFAIFWFTLALVLLLVLLVPKLDSRQITNLLESERRQGLLLGHKISNQLAADPQVDLLWWPRLIQAINKWTPPGQRLMLLTHEGRILGIQPNELSLARILRNFIGQADNTDTPKKKKYDGIEMLGPFVIHDTHDNYQLYLVRPANSPQSDFINLLFDRPLLMLLFTMLISSPLLLWLAWSLAKPARKLKQAADDVTRGNLQPHPELESGPLEFRSTGASFNQMITTLANLVTARQRLISDISHELRSPLTRLQLATALLRRRYGEGRELERIEIETQRLDSMINELLDLSHHQQQPELSMQTLKTNEIWSSILEDAKFEAEQTGKLLSIITFPEDWSVYGNQQALESALENVIRNALRYAYHRIDIRFSRDQQGIRICVDDDGPGVTETERQKIFLPFYRTDEARDRASGGTGLGLAIVESAIRQHQGWVSAESGPLKGLRLTLWLPEDKQTRI